MKKHAAQTNKQNSIYVKGRIAAVKTAIRPLSVKRLTAVGEIRRIRLFILFVAGLILLQIVGCLVGGAIGSLIGSAVGGLIIGFLCVLIGLVLHEESLLQIFRNSRMDQWKTTHVPLTILV